MELFAPEELAGLIEDTGLPVLVGSITIPGLLRSSYTEGAVGLGVEDAHQYIVVTEADAARAGLRKGISLTYAGNDYRVKKMEQITVGLVRAHLTAP